MIQYHVFPNGKKRMVTFSYDDGHEKDKRLIEIFNKYGVKATFHLNGMNYIGKTDAELKEIKKIYEGHEISCHTLMHGWPARMPMQSFAREIIEDRKILEKIAEAPVIGMSYPSGSFDGDVEQVLDSCGIVYSRTTVSNMEFCLPKDFLAWSPTCHHNDALALCDTFLNSLESEWTHPLFYIWGHSHEFRTEADWNYITEVVEKLAGNDKIWYATNIEIYNYFKAQKMLQISWDEKHFYNPTATDVWVEKDKKDIICINAGEKI